MTRWLVVVGLAWLSAAAFVAGAAPLPDAEMAADAESCGYDIFATLADVGPHQQILLDWADGSGLVLTFDGEATTLSLSGGDAEQLIGQGEAASPAQVHVKRRTPMLEVCQKGQVLLRTWSQHMLAGQVAPSTEARLEDFRVQPVGDLCFQDEFSDPRAADDAWEALRGTWRLGIYRDPLIARDNGPIGASWYEIENAERALAVTGHDFWDSYQARVAARATDQSRLGLVFYCRNADNYALLSARSSEVAGEGVAAVSLVREGKEVILGQRTVPWLPGTWYELSVEAHDEQVSCRVAGAEVFGLALPAFTGGRVGVFANGAELAKFDGMDVRSLQAARDDFDRPELGQCWKPTRGAWDVADGRLHGTSPEHARCLRVGAGWARTSVAANVTPRSGAAGVYLNWTSGSGYTLTVGDEQYTIARFVKGKKTILARGRLAETARVRLHLSYADGRLCGRAGSIEDTVYDFDAPRGECGLLVAGKAEFDGFEAREPQPPGAQISSVTGAPEYVPGEREGLNAPVLGYVWRPQGGRWSARSIPDSGPGLGPDPAGEEPAALWYSGPCLGEAVMAAENCTMAPGSTGRLPATLGLAVACEDTDIRSGYALEASGDSPVKLRLLRRGETVAETEIGALTGDDLSLWRDGDYIVGTAGDAGLAYKDEQPLAGGRCCVYARGNGVVVGKISLGNRHARHYSFNKVETDWQPEEGEWLTHSGMACMAWDYWLTGKGTPRAMTYNVYPQSDNLQVDFWVSEYTEGYANGEHRHFPYYNISLVTCAKTRSLDSGYRFLIGGEGGGVTQILRLGEVVAETRDRRFGIIRIGGHCASPRVVHVSVTQLDGEISLRLNGVEALTFTDPEPLGPGYVGIGTAECAANFRDFWMAPARGGT